MRYYTFILTIIIISSCKQAPELAEKNIRKAGRNKIELNKVIDHYSKDRKDRQKLKAAYHLLSYMGDKVKVQGEYYQLINATIKNNSQSNNQATKARMGELYDSIEANLFPLYNQMQVTHDLQTITAAYLMAHIDSTYEKWKRSNWKKEIGFENYCEYILPYKIHNETPQSWHNQVFEVYEGLYDSVMSKNKMYDAYTFLNDTLQKIFNIESSTIMDKIPYDKTFSNFYNLRFGNCVDYTNFAIFIMRSFGIPCAYDYLPAWGNTKQATHTMASLICNEQDFVNRGFITNINDTTKKNHVLDGSTVFDARVSDTRTTVDVQFKRRVPKVYRKKYSYNNKLVALQKKYPREFHPNYRAKNIFDVTNEYAETGEVEIEIPGSIKNVHIAYLCMFSRAGWVPVSYAEVNKGKAEFKSMGKNLMYFPMVYNQEQLIPIGNPIILKLDNTTVQVSVNINNTEKVSLTRKYPLLSRIVNWGRTIHSAEVLVSKYPDFKDSVRLPLPEDIPVTIVDLPIEEDYSPRYFRFTLLDSIYWLTLGELRFFYRDEENNEIPLSHSEFSVYGDTVEGTSKLFDYDYNSFYSDERMIPMKHLVVKFLNPNKNITRISICPRTDSNFIEPGDTYELLYWNNGWYSLGKTVGIEMDLEYDTPKGAVLWLRNLTKGSEERPFIWQNGKQVFW